MPSAGKAWEMRLARWHREYWYRRRAAVWKSHPELKLVAGKWIPSGVGQPDFSGCLAGGRMVSFDAKETSKRVLERRAIADHQAQALSQVVDMGGLAFIAARFVALDTLVVFPWADIAGGTGSLKPGDGIPMGEDGWISWAEGA